MDKRIAVGIVALGALAFGLTVYFYNQALGDIAVASCTDMVNCAHQRVVETQNIVIGVLILMAGALGAAAAYMYYSGKEGHGAAPHAGLHPAGHAAHARAIDDSGLDGDAKKVVAVLREKGGSAFQSDVIRETGYSKVKVSRILDRMEHGGLVERKRRGMANLVVIK